MSEMLTHNLDEQAAQINTIAERMKAAIITGAGEALDIVAVRAQLNMINPGGEKAPTNASRLTTRTGRLMRSIAPGGGVFTAGGSREQIREVIVKDRMVIAVFGSKVEYLPPHEYGGAMPAREMTVTDKMRKFFWAKMYETGDEKFKGMALSQKISIPGYNMPHRPVITPAAKESVPDIEKLMKAKLEALAVD
jgi:hypothetical protein